MTKDITAAIVTRLLADTAIAAKVSTRIYRASFATNPTFPCITVNRVSGLRPNETHNRTRIGQSRIQVSAWAPGDDDADELCELVGNALHGLDSTGLSGIHIVRIDDRGVVADVNPKIGVYVYHRDFLVRHYY